MENIQKKIFREIDFMSLLAWIFFNHSVQKNNKKLILSFEANSGTFPEYTTFFYFLEHTTVHFTNFSIAFPGPPDPPRNCTLSNQTHDSLQVDCQEGFGSGLNQEFHMEVFSELQLLVNITARSPRWVHTYFMTKWYRNFFKLVFFQSAYVKLIELLSFI